MVSREKYRKLYKNCLRVPIDDLMDSCAINKVGNRMDPIKNGETSTAEEA